MIGAAVVSAGLLLTPALPDPAVPRVRYAVPLAVPAGFAGKLTVRGHKLDAVTAASAAGPGGAVKVAGKGRKAAVPGGVSPAAAGDTEIDLEVSVPKDFGGPAVLLAVTAPGGRSKPFPLPLDPPGVVAEVEPNDGFAQAQRLTLPVTVAAVIQRERDVDVFMFTLAAGQPVRAAVTAAKLGSPAELTLTAWDADRRIVAALDGSTGPEPAIDFVAPRAGAYYLTVGEVRDAGGPGFGYRLAVAGR